MRFQVFFAAWRCWHGWQLERRRCAQRTFWRDSATAEITPEIAGDKPVYIAGYGMGRKATGVHDPLMARAVVLASGEQRIALASVDLVGLQYPEVQGDPRQAAGLRLCPGQQHAQPRRARRHRHLGTRPVSSRRRSGLPRAGRQPRRPGDRASREKPAARDRRLWHGGGRIARRRQPPADRQGWRAPRRATESGRAAAIRPA